MNHRKNAGQGNHELALLERRRRMEKQELPDHWLPSELPGHILPIAARARGSKAPDDITGTEIPLPQPALQASTFR